MSHRKATRHEKIGMVWKNQIIAYTGHVSKGSALAPLLNQHEIREMTNLGEVPQRGCRFALDNGAFGCWINKKPFASEKFMRTVEKCAPLNPDFIVIPDIVTGGLASLQMSLEWIPRLRNLIGRYQPLALVVQDGMEPHHIEPYKDLFEVLFVGGSRDWKYATGALWVQWANWDGRPVHIGGIGSPQGVRWARSIGVTSIDSTGPLWTQGGMAKWLASLTEELTKFHGPPKVRANSSVPKTRRKKNDQVGSLFDPGLVITDEDAPMTNGGAFSSVDPLLQSIDFKHMQIALNRLAADFMIPFHERFLPEAKNDLQLMKDVLACGRQAVNTNEIDTSKVEYLRQELLSLSNESLREGLNYYRSLSQAMLRVLPDSCKVASDLASAVLDFQTTAILFLNLSYNKISSFNYDGNPPEFKELMDPLRDLLRGVIRENVYEAERNSAEEGFPTLQYKAGDEANWVWAVLVREQIRQLLARIFDLANSGKIKLTKKLEEKLNLGREALLSIEDPNEFYKFEGSLRSNVLRILIVSRHTCDDELASVINKIRTARSDKVLNEEVGSLPYGHDWYLRQAYTLGEANAQEYFDEYRAEVERPADWWMQCEIWRDRKDLLESYLPDGWRISLREYFKRLPDGAAYSWQSLEEFEDEFSSGFCSKLRSLASNELA